MFLKSHTVSIPELYSKSSSTHTFSELVSTDDWSSDQYRWVNQGVRSLPKKNPLVRKSYFQVHTPDGPSKEFTRHAYQLLPPNSSSITLVHYIGNENAAVDFPHGNQKHNKENAYTGTCPSVLRNLETECAKSIPSKVYRSAITKIPSLTHMPVLQP